MTQRHEFVTEMIGNVTIFTRLDENVNKILFLDVNVTNFSLDEKCQYFLWEKNVSNLF